VFTACGIMHQQAVNTV